RPMLAMFEPTTLPSAMSVVPWSAAPSVTASSGAEVPKPTTTSPMMNWLMPKRSASPEAPRTKTSAPTASRATPRTNSRICSSITDSSHKHGDGFGEAVDGNDLNAARRLLRCVRLRHHDAFEAVRGGFADAFLAVRHRADLAGQADFAEGGEAMAERAVAETRQ